ncbi:MULTISPECIES: glycerophosphodiester phosphodiesterase family protein [Streptomyces]|uniref:glycerophosphodiester phosphodiesterase family protein n=1 Tax=Streptomyces TaxID=1883 RepID=UPI001E45DB66|nr:MULTISPECIES: glycerophosphodiester phosphodiesterase family protein [Streptomyces]UFQ16968.1 carbohydrate-binding protein [Streptomyces huasconensis]WCL86570.1 glycerophosphodiester phosphodiesterase family protein [Streptomyces sp. JCM 35825]
MPASLISRRAVAVPGGRPVTALATVVLCVTLLCAAPPATAAPEGAVPHGAPAETPADRAHRDFLDHGPKAGVMTVAHRGQWRKAPENSIAAIRAGFADGAGIVEVDVRLTRDKVPVLMHDERVDRTTNGTGRVADLTLAQLRGLRLRVGLGGRQAAVTGERVPTLAEAILAARTLGLVNLDRAWQDREAVWRVLQETGTVRNGLFKSRAPVPEVRAFLDGHRDALYMHVVDDANAVSVAEFGTARPPAFEVVFDDVRDKVAAPAFLQELRATGRVWFNTMREGYAARFTDEASLIDPARGWGALITHYRATVIQTDNVEALRSYLTTGVADPVPPGAVRVQGEDYAPGGRGRAYHDIDPGNRGDGPGRPGEDVDICDHDGAVVVCWMRGSEWLTYGVDVPKDGRYTLKARASSPYAPAGTYRLAYDGGPPGRAVPLANTTAHHAFVLQDSRDPRQLARGHHHIRLSLDAGAFQNWNLDYLQLEPVGP